jgi:hypothetical protein
MSGGKKVMKANTMSFNIFRQWLLVTATLLTASPVAAQINDAGTILTDRDLREFQRLLPGVFTNEEQVYFQSRLGVPEADHVARGEIIVERTGQNFSTVITWANGQTIEARHDYRIQDGVIRADARRFDRMDCSRTITRQFDTFHGAGCEGALVVSPDGIRLTNARGTYNFLRARTFKCWVSPRKTDGSYAFYNDLVLHDQGGRVWIEATADHPRVGLKLRNVNWPSGVNRDSLVLYTYQGDDEDYSPGYVWADPDSDRLAINSRWLQASCKQSEESYSP